LVVAVVGVLASATEMALLFHPHIDPSRIYYGTDTRAQDILTGAALGILLFRRPAATRKGARIGFSWLAVIAAAVFVLEWWRINGSSDIPYRGGFLVADVMVALVICGVTMAPSGLPARVLSFAPLTFIGRISYGLYLWHWPIFLVLDKARTGLEGYSLFVLRFLVTFVIAVLSWYLVETPVRQKTFGNWRSWAWVPVGVVAVVGVLLVTTVDSGAADNVLLSPKALSATLTAYEHDGFPTGGHQTRVLVVGDSLSLTVGYWMTPYQSQYGMVIRGRPLDGCGIATALPFNYHGVVTYGTLAPCTQWPTLWQSEVTTLHPQVVALVIGWWDCMDRVYQGTWQHLGDPAFDAYETSQLQRAVAILGSGGAHVALMTSPYYSTGEQLDGQPWDEDSPARVDVLNRIIESVATMHSGAVSIVPLHKYLDPDGHYTLTINGKVMRFADGVHTTQAAGTYLAPKILPQLAAMAPGH
jgi:hypothetical protein